MESMRRGEANHSHHPNKVAINNLATDSNKQANTSSVSGSTLNNNKISFNNQQQQQTTASSESKESNFEYDDNEWDVGGIGDLIIDLDNDIEQSSGSSVQQISSDISSSSSSIASLSSPSNTSITNQSSSNTQPKQIQPKVSTSTTNVLNLAASRPNKTAFASVATPKQQLPTNTSSSVISSKTQLSSAKQSQPSQQHPPSPTTPTAVPQSALIAQLNSNRQVGFVDANQKSIPENMSSTPSGQGAGKAGTKISIDHQSLKMKIKRTKPGTKTSEAKHEIVKADMQNGAISGADDSSSSTSSSGKTQRTPLTSSPAILTASATTAATSANSTPQTTKRGCSGHRRDKTKEKTSHSQRDKNDQLSQQQSHNNSSSQNNDRTSCTCSHDGQVNGSTQTPCSNGSCVRNRTIDTTNMPLVQRTSSNSQSNSNSTNNSNSTPLAAGVIPTGIFAASSITAGAVPMPTSGTTNANAPGPPKDGKIASNLHHPTPVPLPASIPSTTISNIQQQSSASTTTTTSTTTTASSSALMKSSSTSSSSIAPSSVNSSSNSSSSSTSNCDESTSPPPSKKIKFEPKEMVDVCVGTSVGTITEPDCLGPCEPGTSVTLEGIVWHETEGGVLVVNVTWRGKTYVGTLMDCTRHEWAPPRFCDSPTEELDSRTPKGRGKRGRSAAQQPSNDLSNFTETRSSVHSKLRNGGAKGRGGRTATTTGTTTSTTNTTTTATATTTSTSTNSSSSNSGSNTSSNTPSTSPTSFLPPRPEKRKSKDESPSPVNGESETKSLINPLTGLNVQIPAKKVKTTAPCAISPVLLECPEQDCSKKYKHANGLKYHQSHAHGAGSMDEDSQQPPESPRVAPPTTPSPAPATPQPISQTSQPMSSSPPSTPLSNSNSSIAQTLPTQEPSTPTPSSPLPASTTPSIPIPTTISNTPVSAAGLLTPVTLTPGTTQPQLLAHPVAGGSITTGVAGPGLQQQQQQPILATNPSLSDSNLSPIPASPQQPQQLPQQSLMNSGIVQTPTRSDVQGKIKTGVLRFGPAPEELNRLSNSSVVTTPTALSQSPLRAAPLSSMTRMAAVPATTPESSLQPSDYSTANQSNVASIPIVGSKSQKKRKEGSGIDYESSSSNRDDVQSPAYSDISDDSTPVVDTDLMDKTQTSKHPESVKKINDGPPAQIGPLSGYNMFPFYPQQPYLPPDHQSINKPPSVQSSLNPSAVQDYNKVKEPPLDLMTKPSSNSQDPLALSKENSSASPQAPPSKFMGNYYPYNYIPPGYPSYNLDPNYGAVSMVSDDSKISNQQQQQPSSLKEERLKENPSPNEHPKMQPQLLPTKLIKTETPATKDSKQEAVGHSMHQQKDHSHSMGSYPMYARHGMNVPPPQQPQHMSREEELRRYYMTYPDQRRSSTSSNSSSTNLQSTHIKEEPPSPSSQSLQNPPTPDGRQSSQMGPVPPSPQQQMTQQQMTQQQQQQSQQQQQQQHRSSSQKSSSQKSSSLLKDIKSEEKEMIKIKQEGQKPTMETQGPPPPPTSQYYIHPSYMGPGPFGFDGGHPMYRNMIVPGAPYNPSPYHLQMARFHAPEDLSRNPNTKALDLLQHHASQYYQSHKIHELSERALKSPNSNAKVSVSSPNVPQQNSASTQGGIPPSNTGSSSLNLQPPPTSMPPGSGGISLGSQKGSEKPGSETSIKDGPGGPGRSPPPQRHVHTHHHTHVGLGYPMYPAPYGAAAVLASQQAAAVVINPFPPGPTK